jgi:hypothetical protein
MQLVNLSGVVAVPGHPANAYPNRHGYLLEGIVVHTMAGTLTGCDSWFANPAAHAGTHFGIGRAGEVHQFFDLRQGPFAHGAVEPGCAAKLVRDNGAHANPNWYLVGIEHDDEGHGAPPTEVQLERSAQLAAVLFRDHILPHAARTGANIDRDHILRHSDISPRSRPNCCGWPEEQFDRYIQRVRQLIEGTPSTTPADGTDWLALAIDAAHIDGNANQLCIAATEQDGAAALSAIANVHQAVENAARRLQ